MLRSLAVAAIALALTAPPVLAATTVPILLAKTSKWEINYDEDACNLLARFGEGDLTTFLKITRVQPGDAINVALYGKHLKHRKIATPMELAFGSQTAPYQRNGTAMTASGESKLPLVVVERLRLDGWDYPVKGSDSFAIPFVSPEQEAQVTSITFKGPDRKVYLLQTGSLGRPMVAMRKCVDDLLRHWGYDPQVQDRLSRAAAPIGNQGAWIAWKDFPTHSLLRGHNGIVRFRLDVDPGGIVTGCRILYRTNPDDFADLSCKLLMQRAKMSPALDASGKPVKSFYISQVRWAAGDW